MFPLHTPTFIIITTLVLCLGSCGEVKGVVESFGHRAYHAHVGVVSMCACWLAGVVHWCLVFRCPVGQT